MKPLFSNVLVNGTTIPVPDIAAEAQNHHAPKGKPGIAWRKAARALVIRRLLLDHATGLGLNVDARELEPGKIETSDEAKIRAVMEECILPLDPAENDLRKTYENNKSRYCSPSLFEPAHILFVAPPDNPDKRDEAKSRAQAALKIIARDPKAFERLARNESDCPSRDDGGRLGQLISGDTVPEFEAALEAMNIGDLSTAPLESRYGFHIVRLDAKQAGAVLPYANVRARILEAAEKSAWAVAAQKFTQSLIDAAAISGIEILHDTRNAA